MVSLLMPPWFVYTDLAFELFFAITTLLVGIYALKIYKLTEERQSKIFSLAFFSISASYILQLVLLVVNFLNLTPYIDSWLGIEGSEVLTVVGTYAHMVLFVAGLTALIYLTLNIKNHKTFSLIFVLLIAAILFSANKIFSFYALSFVLLIYITYHYAKNYFLKRRKLVLMIAIAMFSLLASNLFFIIAVQGTGIYYMLTHFVQLMIYILVAHVLELVAYILILLSMFCILKNDKKTK